MPGVLFTKQRQQNAPKFAPFFLWALFGGIDNRARHGEGLALPGYRRHFAQACPALPLRYRLSPDFFWASPVPCRVAQSWRTAALGHSGRRPAGPRLPSNRLPAFSSKSFSQLVRLGGMDTVLLGDLIDGFGPLDRRQGNLGFLCTCKYFPFAFARGFPLFSLTGHSLN